MGSLFRPSCSLVLLSVAWLLACPRSSHAGPQTYFDTLASVTGPVAGGRFGAAMACSDGANTGDVSHFAIGAPEAENGQGRVYIYSVGESPNLIQTLSSPSPANNYNFGTSIAFVSDINGDGKDDLVIGETTEIGINHVLWAFFSQPNGTYLQCGSYQWASPGVGKVLLGQRVLTGTTLSHVIAGLPDSNETRALVMVLAAPGVCSFANVSAHSHFGTGTWAASLAEASSDVDSDGESDILIGAPSLNNSDGYVAITGGGSGAYVSGSGTEQAGAALATELNSVYWAMGRPGASSGAGAISIYSMSASPALMCEVTRTGDGTSTDFGKTLRHLKNSSFPNLFTGADAVFASYRSESATGGSVGIFFQAQNLCTEAYQYNNCVQDPNQEQGSVLGGGVTCTGQIAPGGSNFGVHPVIIVGSPGYGSNRGRIDIVSELSDRAAPVVCGAGNPTPTPTATSTPTAIPVQPGSGNLPKPTVQVAGKTATITAARVKPTLSSSAAQKALAFLLKKGLSPAVARKALKKLRVTYVFRYQKKPGTKGAAIMSDDAQISGVSSIVRSRNNRISLRNLSPGQYATSYQVDISTQNPPFSLGQTRNSPPVDFTIRR